ncbi:MAG: hypothetical protein JNK85_24510 [Verrucomicrobiales bacterium]|nr:hypothetical protein [Verrucomicrobiales bacterium]
MIPSIESLRRASEIIREIEALQGELAGLFGSGAASPAAGRRRGRPPGSGKKARNMSAEGRARIAAAARARWARFHAAKKKAAKD